MSHPSISMAQRVRFGTLLWITGSFVLALLIICAVWRCSFGTRHGIERISTTLLSIVSSSKLLADSSLDQLHCPMEASMSKAAQNLQRLARAMLPENRILIMESMLNQLEEEVQGRVGEGCWSEECSKAPSQKRFSAEAVNPR